MTDVEDALPTPPAEPPAPPKHTSIAELLLVKVPNIVCGWLLVAAVAINVANVIGRYVFFRPIAWAEEVLMFIIIWGIFISAGSITYQGLHLRMDLLVINVRGKFRAFLGGLTVALALLCSLFMIVQTFRIVRIYAASGETSITAGVPLVYTHAALFVGFVLMAVAATLRVRAYLTGKFD